MDSIIEARRAKFEAWMRENGMTRHHPTKHDMWLGFKAALDTLVIEMPELTEPDAPADAIDDSWRDGYTAARRYRSQCRQAIEKAGVRTK